MDYPFTTDGCSGNIYRKLFRRDPPWLGCCVIHDTMYHSGGSWKSRRQADVDLMVCVARNGHPVVAVVMYLAVRVFGSPFLPTPWRWGYGWRWPRWRA